MSLDPAPRSGFDEVDEDRRSFSRTMIMPSSREWQCPVSRGPSEWREPVRVQERLYRDWRSLRITLTPPTEEPYQTTPETALVFTRLSTEWRRATRFSSMHATSWMHLAYQQIIGLGPSVVPLLVDDMQRGNEDWHWALAAITRANPASEAQSAGEATEAWIKWWQGRNLTDARR